MLRLPFGDGVVCESSAPSPNPTSASQLIERDLQQVSGTPWNCVQALARRAIVPAWRSLHDSVGRHPPPAIGPEQPELPGRFPPPHPSFQPAPRTEARGGEATRPPLAGVSY
jgi:hypothetical protein